MFDLVNERPRYLISFVADEFPGILYFDSTNLLSLVLVYYPQIPNLVLDETKNTMKRKKHTRKKNKKE